jgi:hypothetical protein
MMFIRAAAALAAASAMPALATETFLVEMAPKSTHMEVSLSVSVPLAGSLIGDYDPVTNPGGTRTRTTLFGNGNVPIPFTADIRAGLRMDTVPSGSMKMTMGGGEVFIVTDLSLNMLAGGSAPIGTILDLANPVFYTSNPTAVFPGDLPAIPSPAGGITSLSFRQTSPTVGAMWETGKGGTQDFLALVPGELTFHVHVMEESVQLDSLPILLPMAGRLTRDGDSMSVEAGIDYSVQFPVPFQPDPLVNEPFDLPTLLGPAHVLFNADFGELTAENAVNLQMVAEGQPTCSIIDLDGNCESDGGDIGLLLAGWGPCSGGGPCPADFNGDGSVNQVDLAIMLALWGG